MIPMHLFDIKSLGSLMGNPLHRSVNYFVHRDSKFCLPLAFCLSLVRNTYKHMSVMPIEWLDENKTNLIKTIEHTESGYAYGPKLVDGSQTLQKILLSAVNVYCFHNAKIAARSSSILANDKIIIERVQNMNMVRHDYSADHLFMHGQNNALVINRPATHINEGIFMGGNGSSNYYHWLIEILPKLKYFEYLDEEYQKFPLLVSDDVNHIKTFRESLDYINKNRPLIFLDKKRAYLVGKLLHINAPNNLPFNLRRNENIEVSDCLIRPSSINNLRNKLYFASKANSQAVMGNQRLFFARKKERRNYNQEEIFEVFRLRGFERVFMEELTLRNQIEIVSNAEVIAGPTGAAWANLIFCREGTKCLCWMADKYANFSAYSTLAKIVDADLRYVIHNSKAKSTEELYKLDYHVNPHEVEKGLERLLSIGKYTATELDVGKESDKKIFT